MLKKIYKAIDFALTVFMLMVVIAYCQPSEAKPYPSMLTMEKYSEGAAALVETKRHQVSFIFRAKKEVVKITLFVNRILFVEGVVDLFSDDLKSFKVVFDHPRTNVYELVDVINQLVDDPDIYEGVDNQLIDD